MKGSRTNGVCALRDELRPVLEGLHEADVVVLGTPIYYDGMTGEAASLLHRMLFPTVLYNKDQENDRLNPIRKRCGLIVTSQVSRKTLDDLDYRPCLGCYSCQWGADGYRCPGRRRAS